MAGKTSFWIVYCVTKRFFSELKSLDDDNSQLVISMFTKHSLPSFTIIKHKTQTTWKAPLTADTLD